MRIAGSALLVLGFLSCFATDEWEFVGLIPMGIGVICLAIAENRVSALSLAEVASFKRIDKRAPSPSRNQLPAVDASELSSEVLQLLERLNRSSRSR